jgi:hypothetical protein
MPNSYGRGAVLLVSACKRRSLAGFATTISLPSDHVPDKLVNLWQTWGVVGDQGGDERAVRVAHELAECRVRGIDRLDIKSPKQGPVVAPELEQLATRYAAARSLRPGGRNAQIRLLLRAALDELRIINPADEALIRDLFFGDEKTAGRKYPSELLRRAQQEYGERSEGRFREIRNIAFRNFADFLIDFVGEYITPAAQVVAPARSSPRLPQERAEPSSTATRNFYSPSPLVTVLRFSSADQRTGQLTIEEHQKIIDERGKCWWGWFKAAHDVDQSAEIERRLRHCEVGLWERSMSLFYVAECDAVYTEGGDLVETPDPDLTPEYYRAQPYPAWFNFRSIRRSSRDEFIQRFGDLPASPSTIYWSPESVPLPVIIPAHGNAILHLSDLSFGRNHRWSTINAPYRTYMTTEKAIEQTLLTHEIDLTAVGVVVICGNLASEAPSSEAFGEALAFIEGLCEQLPNVSRDHIVVVPGADDFARPGDRELSVQTLYRKFHQSLYGSTEQDISRIRRYEFDTFRLNILPVNSVKMLGKDDGDVGLFGYGYESQLNVMREDYLRHHESVRVINAVAAHHHIVATPVRLSETARKENDGAYTTIMRGMQDARDVFTRLGRNRIALYLHGHLHEGDCYAVVSDGVWQTAICGSGTAGASDRWLRAHYRDSYGNSLALIDVERDRIRGRIFVYNEDPHEDHRHSSSPFRQFHINDQQIRAPE